MRRILSYAQNRWSRHSRVLLVAGMIYVAIGISYISAYKNVQKSPSLKVALSWLDLPFWIAIFLAVGFLVICSAFSRIGRKTWGYMLLAALSSTWAAFYILAFLFKGAPALTLVSGLTWLLLAFVWVQISGLISPESLVHSLEVRNGDKSR